MVFNTYCPIQVLHFDFPYWLTFQSYINEFERDLDVQTKLKYIVFPVAPTWRTLALRSKVTPEPRLPFPETWRALNGSDLDKVTGIPGGIFVHRMGFIAGHNTREGAIQMAIQSLLQPGASSSSNSRSVEDIDKALLGKLKSIF
jgi:uncharacterized UPF0160 family protein